LHAAKHNGYCATNGPILAFILLMIGKTMWREGGGEEAKKN
jgi:hypothetical protein